MERKKSSVVEIRKILDGIILLLEENITNNFCPLRVKTILNNLLDYSINTRELSTKVKGFCNAVKLMHI